MKALTAGQLPGIHIALQEHFSDIPFAALCGLAKGDITLSIEVSNSPCHSVPCSPSPSELQKG